MELQLILFPFYGLSRYSLSCLQILVVPKVKQKIEQKLLTLINNSMLGSLSESCRSAMLSREKLNSF